MIKKNEFIELSFTGKIANTDEIFDTNIKSDAEVAGFNTEGIEPFVLAVGHEMLPKGFDEDLVGKETGKKYTLNLIPEKAFGKRNKDLVKMIPTKYFHEQKIDPVRGMQLNLDGQIVKILSSDRGRTLVDFNNPLAGKPIVYTYTINKIIAEQEKKINALQSFWFKNTFKFEVIDKVITFEVPKEIEQFIKMFSKKFEEILGLKAEAKVIEEAEKNLSNNPTNS